MLRILNIVQTTHTKISHRYFSSTIYQLSSIQYTYNCSYITLPATVTGSKKNKIVNRSPSVCVQKNYSTRTIHSEENISILKKVLNKVKFTPNLRSQLKIASYLLYENVADRINYLDFFEEFNLPNTFNSWFLVTELHVWMILLRSMAEGPETGDDGRFLRNTVVEAMWSDVNIRAKKLGASNPSGTRAQIEILSEQFQAALIAYDEGIMSDDKTLAGAIWRRFFEQKCDNYIKLEKLVKYVRKQIQILDSIQRNELIFRPKISWLNINEI